MIVLIIALLGMAWIALAFLGVALFALLLPLLGMAGAAVVTSAVFLIFVLIGGFVLNARMAAAKRSALLAGLATSGVANAVLGFAVKRPVLALGIGGAVAAFLARSFSPPR